MAAANTNAKPVKNALKDALAGFDMKSIVGDLTGILQSVVADATDPRLQVILTDLATDALKVQAMKASGASPEIIAEAEEAIRARVQSVTKIPGLIAAGRRDQVLGVITRGLNLVSNVAFNFLRSWAGLPAAPAAPAETT